MANKWRIPEEELKKLLERDKKCAYCDKKMIYPTDRNNICDSWSTEHLNFDGPFYMNEENDKGLKIKDIVICCRSCNSSRGVKRLIDWFKAKYCIDRNINENTVAKPVKEYLRRNPKK
jgi:hypothetical protein